MLESTNAAAGDAILFDQISCAAHAGWIEPASAAMERVNYVLRFVVHLVQCVLNCLVGLLASCLFPRAAAAPAAVRAHLQYSAPKPACKRRYNHTVTGCDCHTYSISAAAGL